MMWQAYEITSWYNHDNPRVFVVQQDKETNIRLECYNNGVITIKGNKKIKINDLRRVK
jgi:hypothetical protein